MEQEDQEWEVKKTRGGNYRGKNGRNNRNKNNRGRGGNKYQGNRGRSNGILNRNNYPKKNNRRNTNNKGLYKNNRGSFRGRGTRVGISKQRDFYQKKNMDEINKHLEIENMELKSEISELKKLVEKLKEEVSTKDLIIQEMQTDGNSYGYKSNTFQSNGDRILHKNTKTKNIKKRKYKKAKTFAPTESQILAESEKLARELQMEEYAYQMQIDQIMKMEQGNQEEEMLRRAMEESKKANPDVINPDAMTYEELMDLGDKIGTVSKGLSKNMISKIKRFNFSLKNHDQTECIVCASEYKIGHQLIRLPCDHVFDECILKWFEDNRTCPICKEEVNEDTLRKQRKRSKLKEINRLRIFDDEEKSRKETKNKFSNPFDF